MKLLILDKDGTLVKPISGGSFVQSPCDQELLSGVANTLARYQHSGWQMAIASNQGGVASWHKTLDDAIEEMFFAMALTKIQTAAIAHSYEDEGYGEFVSLTLFDDGSKDHRVMTNGKLRFRKPEPGMIKWLVRQHDPFAFPPREARNHDYKEGVDILFIGDRPEDEQAAAAAGVPFQWADQFFSPEYCHGL